MRLNAKLIIFTVYLYVVAHLPRTCECRAQSSSTTQASAVSQSAPSHLSAPTTITDRSLNTTTTTKTTVKSSPLDTIRAFIAKTMSSSGSGVARKILQSDISSQCSIGMLKFMKALVNVEPWALRIIDSTAKLPTGLFQSNNAELGAYDECVETVVRGDDGVERVRAQYCNFYLQTGNPSEVEDIQPMLQVTHKRARNFSSYLTEGPGLRLGVCFISDCTEEDLQKIVDTLLGGVSKIVVRNCVTSRAEPVNTTQVCIIAVLGTILATVILSTAFDYSSAKWKNWKSDGYLLRFLTAFSLIKNTKYLFKANTNKSSETYAYAFVHGLRIISTFWVILGHSYGTAAENASRMINALYMFEHWHGVIVTFGFQAVDTFFFLSGFFTFFKLDKENGNPISVTLVAVVRRFIRMTIPTFFMIMCIYILPLIASGPNSKEYYTRFYAEIRDVWWNLLLLIRNWKEDPVAPILSHVWYLSTDFQLFLVSIIIIQALKAKKGLAASLFGVLSLGSCAIAAWQVYGTRLPPFMIAMTDRISLFMDQYNKYYKLPFYHGVCYFSGCITFVIVRKYSHRRIPGVFQAACWCVALFCGLFCLFVKHEWYAHDGLAPEPTRMFYAFADRIFFSVFLSWLMFACATRRAEPLRRLLSWQGLLPLSRLSFGVYLLHFPLYMLTHYIARERTLYSHYTLVSESFAVLVWSYILSYVMFIMCEGPTANLEMLLFMGRKSRQNEGKNIESKNCQFDQKKLQLSSDNAMVFSGTEVSCVAEKVCRL